MGDKIDDGGPAFPMAAGVLQRGMTLRDWFAGQTLPHLVPLHLSVAGALSPQAAEFLAADAYALADAMLAERQKGK